LSKLFEHDLLVAGPQPTGYIKKKKKKKKKEKLPFKKFLLLLLTLSAGYDREIDSSF
jgi:hypothetical protein